MIESLCDKLYSKLEDEIKSLCEFVGKHQPKNPYEKPSEKVKEEYINRIKRLMGLVYYSHDISREEMKLSPALDMLDSFRFDIERYDWVLNIEPNDRFPIRLPDKKGVLKESLTKYIEDWCKEFEKSVNNPQINV